MKRINCIVLALSAAALLTLSCSKTGILAESSSEGTGSVTLGVTLPQTKAALSQEELLSGAKVRIYMGDFSGLVRDYVYSELPQTIYLPADDYRVDVIAGEAAKSSPTTASWEQKSYRGSKSFTVTSGGSTSVQVVAGVSNAVSKISFDSTVSANFQPGFSLTVALDEDRKLVYDAAKSGSEGYFIIDGMDEPEFTWTFSGNLLKDGSAFTKSGKIEGVESGKVYSMTLKYTIKDGEVNFDLLVDYATDIIDDTVVFEPVSTGLSASGIYEIWAGHATVHADVDEGEFSDPSAIKFAYRVSGSGNEWTSVAAERASEGVYNAVLRGLKGATKYDYKLVIAGVDQGEALSFTTEAAPNVPNASFEYVSKVSGKSYYKFYDPGCDVEDCRTMFWGSGNGEGSEGVNGSANMGIVITEPSDDAKDGSRSVCAMSKSAVGMLAAGNLFTGQFAGLIGTSGGKVNFGRPWTSRPTGVRVWVKYSGGNVNIITRLPEGADFKKGDKDRANIKIALGTWNYKTYGGTKDSPVQVNTTDASTFVDYRTDASTIADGELILFGDGFQQINGGEKQTAAVDQWRQVTIPFNYHKTNEYPTHIVISCAASMYGDYFSGSDSSKFWIDGVELLYE